MLHRICQELTRDDVKDLLFLCENVIGRSRREQIKDPRDLLYILEQTNIVGPQNLHFLTSVLAEISRHDLAQRVEEHCRSDRIQPCRRLEADDVVWPNSHGETGKLTPSSVVRILPHYPPASSNEVVTYNPARVLEPDDAVPFIPFSQHVSTRESSDANDAHVVYSVSQTQIDRIIQNIEEPIPRGIPGNKDEDMPCYRMSSNPRGNIYTALSKLLLLLLLLLYSFTIFYVMCML